MRISEYQVVIDVLRDAIFLEQRQGSGKGKHLI